MRIDFETLIGKFVAQCPAQYSLMHFPQSHMQSRNDNDVVVVVAVVVFVLQAESGVILNIFTLCMTQSGAFY